MSKSEWIQLNEDLGISHSLQVRNGDCASHCVSEQQNTANLCQQWHVLCNSARIDARIDALHEKGFDARSMDLCFRIELTAFGFAEPNRAILQHFIVDRVSMNDPVCGPNPGAERE